MGSWISTEVGLGVLRNVLMSAGMSYVTEGLITRDGLNSIVGAVVAILMAVMSAWSNHNKAKANAIVKAVNDHPNIRVVPSAVTGKPTVFVTPSLSSAGAK